MKAYPSVLEIPDDVDLAFIVVPSEHVLDAARECAEKGVRGLVVISAGFARWVSEGAAKEQALLEIVREGGMRMVGPNCMGLLNTSPSANLNGTFAPVFPPVGNIAMSSQSGALGYRHSRVRHAGIASASASSSRSATRPTSPVTTCCCSGRTTRRPM